LWKRFIKIDEPPNKRRADVGEMDIDAQALIECRPPIAYFAQFDGIFDELVTGTRSLASFPPEFHSAITALTPKQLRAFASHADAPEAALAQGLELLESGQLKAADEVLRKSVRMWPGNTVGHAALLSIAAQLGLGHDELQPRLFAAAKGYITLAISSAAVVAFGPNHGGSAQIAANALELLCSGLASEHPARGAVFALTQECFFADADFAPIGSLLWEQFKVTAITPVTDNPEVLLRLAHATYTAEHLLEGRIRDRVLPKLTAMLGERHCGMWELVGNAAPWKFEEVRKFEEA
jgi:hypothetical protein